MSTPPVSSETPAAPLSGELRYGVELARLLADPLYRRARPAVHAPAVLLVPGFMAGDRSLSVLAAWLKRRGCRTSGAGMVVNADCAERAVERVERRLRRLEARTEGPAVVVGQSRGGGLGRVVALRNPHAVSALVMLGSPVLGPLKVGPAVLSTVRSIARLGDLGVPGMFSSECRDGACCAAFRKDLVAPLPQGVRAVSVYSRSDPIVAYPACLDPCAEHVEVNSSHTGMSVNVEVYRVIAEVLDGQAAQSERRAA